MNEVRPMGGDLSLNHGAVVRLDPENGEVVWFSYVTPIKEARRQYGDAGYGIHLPADQLRKQCHDPHRSDLVRLMWWDGIFESWFRQQTPTHFAVENYAYRAQSNSAYQIGEAGGLVRRVAWNAGVKMRLHEPMTVKKFATGNGGADADDVAKSVIDRWWPGLGHLTDSTPKKGFLFGDVVGDLAAAYTVARLLWTELRLRDGTLTLRELDPKQIEVFNRVTKPYPINILSREWICPATLLPKLLPGGFNG